MYNTQGQKYRLYFTLDIYYKLHRDIDEKKTAPMKDNRLYDVTLSRYKINAVAKNLNSLNRSRINHIPFIIPDIIVNF
jgi:hypothetical protein